MAVNTLLAGGKFLAGIFGHSHALVADAVESFADVLGSLIVWRSLVVAAKPADEDHPYGHGKAEPLAAAVISSMLLLAAAGIAAKALEGILNPHESPEPFTLAVLLGVILIKELLYRFAARVGHEEQSTVVKTDAWHHRSDAITSLAAAIGITVALIGGKDYARADDVAAIVAAGIIAWNGWQLLKPALSELMDTVPDPALRGRIAAIAEKVPDVRAVEKCLVRKMGYHLFVDMHVHVDPQMTVDRAHRVAHAVKDAVRKELPVVYDVLVHIEPAKVRAA
ncbi:MAG: cation transporter [Verrucomicrobia bacterium]|nr:cation transporter [Verrucomicrobiota bacterium]